MIWTVALFVLMAYEAVESAASRLLFRCPRRLKDWRRRKTEWPRVL